MAKSIDDVKNDIDAGANKADSNIDKAINKIGDVTEKAVAPVIKGGQKADENIEKIESGYGKVKGAAAYSAHSLGLDKFREKNVTMSRQRGTTLASLARSNIFEFPVFVSDTVTVDKMTALNQLLEQMYGSYLQMAISLNPVVDADTVRSGDIFANFKTDTNRYLECTDVSYMRDACHNIIQEGKYVYEFSMISINSVDNRIIQETVNHQPLSEFDHFFQESLFHKDKKKGKNKDEKKGQGTSSNEDDCKKKYTELKEGRAAAKEKRDVEKYNADKIYKKKEERRSAEKHLYDTKLKTATFMDETKLQKLNTLKPYMMTVSMSVADKNGGISRPIDYMVGVKTYCRIIDSSILPEMVEFPSKEMNQLSRKAKWRAGELKFWEYLFHINAKKQTAIDAHDPKRKWYRRLYELAHVAGDAKAGKVIAGKRSLNGLRKSLTSNKALRGVMPNVTIVITQGDVDNIKSETNIDLMKPSKARMLCNELFLIALVVIDEDKEVIKMLIPDLHDDYEIHSMASLNKQIAMLDSSKAIGLNDILGKR